MNKSSEKEVETKRDAALARALSTPHKPQKLPKKMTKKAKAKK